MSRQPLQPIDQAQHIRHQYVGDGESPGQPFASCQHLLQVLEAASEELVQPLRCRRVAGVRGRNSSAAIDNRPYEIYSRQCRLIPILNPWITAFSIARLRIAINPIGFLFGCPAAFGGSVR
jgi:hypothetical protein